MTTTDPVLAVQQGLKTLFQSDAVIQDHITGGILGEFPDVSARQYPFMVIPELTSVPDGTHDDPGRRITANIQTLVRGDVAVAATRIDQVVGARIVELTDHRHRLLDTHVDGPTVWMVRHIESRKMPDADRTVRRRMDRVDIWTSQI